MSSLPHQGHSMVPILYLPLPPGLSSLPSHPDFSRIITTYFLDHLTQTLIPSASNLWHHTTDAIMCLHPTHFSCCTLHTYTSFSSNFSAIFALLGTYVYIYIYIIMYPYTSTFFPLCVETFHYLLPDLYLYFIFRNLHWTHTDACSVHRRIVFAAWRWCPPRVW